MPVARSGAVRIHWEESGAGEPLLLVMGTGYTLEMWHRVREQLATRFRVIVFDNRGVGRSDVPPPPYTVAEMTGDALAVLDDSGVQRAHVAGAWLGGAIASELALTRPERVRSLLLAATCAFPHVADPDDEVLSVLARRPSMEPGESARATIPFLYGPGTPQALIEADLEIRVKHHPTPDGYVGQRHATANYTNRDRLDQLRMPVLVVHGEADRLVPPENGADLARLVPGARHVVVSGAGHNLFTDRPDEFVRLVHEFVDTVPA